MTSDEQLQREKASLVRLEAFLYNIDEGKPLSAALDKLENDDEENANDDDNFTKALKYRRTPTGPSSPIGDKKIILNKNKSTITFNGKPVVNKKLTAENDDSDNLPWLHSSPTKRKNLGKPLSAFQRVDVVHAQNDGLPKVTSPERRQIIRSAKENSRAEREPINPTAELILRKKLHEDLLTKAQASILPYPSAAEGSPKIPKHVPTEFESAAARKADTLARIPDYFRNPKIEKTVDNSLGAIAQRTKAAATLNRPKSEFRDTANNDQGDAKYNQPSAKIPNIEPPLEKGKSMAASTFKSHPNQEKQWDVSLSNPKKPTQDSNPQGSPYTGAI